MSQQLQPFNPQGAQLPAAIAGALANTGNNLPSALSEGVGSNYANVSFKGKVFRIKYGGQEHTIIDPATRTPIGWMDFVIIDAKGALSKTYYASGYTEGDNSQPDCASEDGVHPHAPPGKQVQSQDCRTCPWNAFGSKKSPDGVATNSKACADTRKLAVVPAQNIKNENFGGPMLLRVPAASLSNLAEFDRSVRAAGAPFYAVVVRVTFDYNVAYPKLVFQAQRFLTDAEAQDVLALRADPRTADIIEGLAPPTAPAPLPGQVPASMNQPVPPPIAQPTPAPVPVAAPPVAPQYASTATTPAPQQTDNVVSFGPPPVVAPPAAPQVAPTIPVTGQPAPAPQVVSFAPPPVAAPPVAAPPVAYAAPPVAAPTSQPTPLPTSVLSAVDELLGPSA